MKGLKNAAKFSFPDLNLLFHSLQLHMGWFLTYLWYGLMTSYSLEYFLVSQRLRQSMYGAKVTRSSPGSEESHVSRSGQSLEEARKLVEQSFGNYAGSNVMLAAKEELARIQNEIQMLTSEITEKAIDKSQKLLSQSAYKEIADLQEELRAEKRTRTELRRGMELERMKSLKPILEELGNGHLLFICLQHTDSDGVQHQIPAVYLGKVDLLNTKKLKNMVHELDSFALNKQFYSSDTNPEHAVEPSYYVALGSDNSWYLSTEKWIKTVYKTGFPNVALALGDALPREIMTTLLDKGEMQWQKVAESELGGVWYMEGSLETWAWSLNVPVLSSLSKDDEVLELSDTYQNAVERYKDQKKQSFTSEEKDGSYRRL